MFGSRKEYRFAVVNFQATMAAAKSEPLAVVVEARSDEYDTVVVFGKRAETVDGASDLAKSVLANLPDLLSQQVRDAVKTKGEESVLAHLGAANRWNIYVSPPESIRTDLPVQAVAGQLFGERVIAPSPQTLEEGREEVFVNTLRLRSQRGGSIG